MGFGGEVELRLLAPGLFLAIAVLVLADGDGVLGQVGQRLHDLAQTVVGGGCGCFERLHLGLECAGLLGLGGGVRAFAAELRDLFGELVALGLQGLDLRDGLAPLAVDGGEISERDGGIHAPGAQFFFDKGQIGPHKR